MPETLETALFVFSVGTVVIGLLWRIVRRVHPGRVFDGAADLAYGTVIFAIGLVGTVAVIVGIGYLLGVGMRL